MLALESSHAIWEAVRLAKTLPKDQDIVVVSLIKSTELNKLLVLAFSVSVWPW